MHVHWAVIILLCIRLEENVKELSALLSKNDKLTRRIEDYDRGNVLEKFRKFLVGSAGWPNVVPTDATWKDISGVYAIRNCLVHKQANFSEYEVHSKKRGKQIFDFCRRHSTPNIVTPWLDIDLSTSLVCVKVVKQFFDEIFAKLKTRPDFLEEGEPDRDELIWSD